MRFALYFPMPVYVLSGVWDSVFICILINIRCCRFAVPLRNVEISVLSRSVSRCHEFGVPLCCNGYYFVNIIHRF